MTVAYEYREQTTAKCLSELEAIKSPILLMSGRYWQVLLIILNRAPLSGMLGPSWVLACPLAPQIRL